MRRSDIRFRDSVGLRYGFLASSPQLPVKQYGCDFAQLPIDDKQRSVLCVRKIETPDLSVQMLPIGVLEFHLVSD